MPASSILGTGRPAAVYSGAGGRQLGLAVFGTVPITVGPFAHSDRASLKRTRETITVSWNGVSGATSYNLQEQSMAAAGPPIQIGRATSQALSGKSQWHAIGYQVQACNG